MSKHGDRDDDSAISWDHLVVFIMCNFWGSFRDLSETLDLEQTREIEECEGRTVERAFSPSALSPRVSRSQMPDDQPIAFRIVGYENAIVPPPTEQLYNELALRGWNDYRRQMTDHVGHEMPTWDDLPDHLKMVWIGVAHGQHGVIAWRGGGKIEMIEDAE